MTHSYVNKYWEGVETIYSGLLNNLPKQHDIEIRLNWMLIQRSMIALNNSAKSVDKNTFKQEIYQIVREKTLRSAVNRIPFWKGIHLFGLYYVLLRLKMYKCIYFRYWLKFLRK